jgi:hypothetical protein
MFALAAGRNGTGRGGQRHLAAAVSGLVRSLDRFGHRRPDGLQCGLHDSHTVDDDCGLPLIRPTRPRSLRRLRHSLPAVPRTGGAREHPHLPLVAAHGAGPGRAAELTAVAAPVGSAAPPPSIMSTCHGPSCQGWAGCGGPPPSPPPRPAPRELPDADARPHPAPPARPAPSTVAAADGSSEEAHPETIKNPRAGCHTPTGSPVAHLPEPRPETVTQQPEPQCPP